MYVLILNLRTSLLSILRSIGICSESACIQPALTKGKKLPWRNMNPKLEE